ncbi:MAG: hypothetical protein GEU92_11695 [Alphaproteobacteria bacterium]|nr:hypothetical protein [Alphaproteobacteria bacterium]
MRHAAYLLVGLGAALAGCSSLSEQETRIATSPAGAECVLEGRGYRETVRTPAAVAPPIAAAPLAVTCTAPGHRAAKGWMKARFDNRMFGNLVFGSSLGVVIDMINDRDRVYPSAYRVHMEPASFRTEAARDAWYGRFRAHVAEKWDRALAARSLDCSESDGGYACVEEVTALREGRGRELAALDARRRNAFVTGETVAEEPRPQAQLN